MSWSYKMFWGLQARRKKYDQLEGSSEGYAGQEWDDTVQLIGPEQLRTRFSLPRGGHVNL